MNETQIKGVEIRIGSCTRWGLAFFAAAALLVSGLVTRYYAGEFDVLCWIGSVVAGGCGGLAYHFYRRADELTTLWEEYRNG